MGEGILDRKVKEVFALWFFVFLPVFAAKSLGKGGNIQWYQEK